MSSLSVDLHLHTTVSDGQASPEELAELALAAGLSAIAVTDHDDLRGSARAAAAVPELLIIPGVEISAKFGDRGVHILAFGVDPSHPGLDDLLRSNRAAKREQADKMLRQLRPFGVPFDVHDFLEGRPPDSYVGRGVIARRIAEHTGKTVRTVFKKWLGFGRLAWVPAAVADAAAVISTVQDAGGVAILAHPGEDDFSLAVPGLLEAGLDGLEVHRPTPRRRLREEAASVVHRHGLLASGGSDWHGGPAHALGDFRVEAEKLAPLLERVAPGLI